MTDSTDQPFVLVARHPERAAPLCKLLEASGLQVMCEPVMESAGVDGDAAVVARRQLEEIATYDRIVVVSAEAGQRAIEVLRAAGQLDAALARPMYAVGSASADQWRELFANIEVPDGESRSETLLALPALQRLDGERILILCGVGGRDLIESELRSRGAEVHRCELYQRRFRPQALEAFMALDRQPDVLLALSGFAARCLALVLKAIDPGLLQRPLVVPGERVARAAGDAGFRCVVAADDVGIVNLLEAVSQAITKSRQN